MNDPAQPRRSSSFAASSSTLGWAMEVVVPTGRPRTEKFPTCYKLDIANPQLKIGVEVDGESHASRRAQDQKKDAFFASIGWTVLRFTNRQVAERLVDCVQMVLSTISKSQDRPTHTSIIATSPTAT